MRWMSPSGIRRPRRSEGCRQWCSLKNPLGFRKNGRWGLRSLMLAVESEPPTGAADGSRGWSAAEPTDAVLSQAEPPTGATEAWINDSVAPVGGSEDLTPLSVGSAALHPRLPSVAHFVGFRTFMQSEQHWGGRQG